MRSSPERSRSGIRADLRGPTAEIADVEEFRARAIGIVRLTLQRARELGSVRSSMLDRVLEPEVMDTPEEARDYDAMDHVEVNARFCDDLLMQGSVGRVVLDVGTGTARIPIELCERLPVVHVRAIDLAVHMLEVATKNLARAGLAGRVRLEKVDAKAMPYDDGSFDTTVSNSIVHHIPEPCPVLAEMIRVTKRSGLVFVRDLVRPASEAEIDRLVAMHGGQPPSDTRRKASYESQLHLLRASLRAAFTVNEVVTMAAAVGIPSHAVTMTSDRHWTLAFRKS